MVKKKNSRIRLRIDCLLCMCGSKRSLHFIYLLMNHYKWKWLKKAFSQTLTLPLSSLTSKASITAKGGGGLSWYGMDSKVNIFFTFFLLIYYFYFYFKVRNIPPICNWTFCSKYWEEYVFEVRALILYFVGMDPLWTTNKKIGENQTYNEKDKKIWGEDTSILNWMSKQMKI